MYMSVCVRLGVKVCVHYKVKCYCAQILCVELYINFDWSNFILVHNEVNLFFILRK